MSEGFQLRIRRRNLPDRRVSRTLHTLVIVHDDRQEGMLDLEDAVVFDETQLLELVHKEVHARARRADHLRKGLLGNLVHDGFGSAFLSEMR